MRMAQFEIDLQNSNSEVLTICDLSNYEGGLSITNDAERVVAYLVEKGILKGRKLNYYDSDGDLSQLLVENNLFNGFAPAYLTGVNN